MKNFLARIGRVTRQPAQIYDVAMGGLIAGTLDAAFGVTGILVFIWIAGRYKDTP